MLKTMVHVSKRSRTFLYPSQKIDRKCVSFFCVRSISAESKEHPHFFTTLKVTLEKIGALTFAASVICPSGILTFLLAWGWESQGTTQ